MSDSVLDTVVKCIVSRFRIYGIILFGSRARGDWGPWSDYDILVIGDFDKPYLDRIKDLLDALSDVKEPIEPHPYTLDEALSMLRKGCPTIVDALEEGVILYKTEELNKLIELFHRLKEKGLKRTSVSIIVPSDI